MAARVGYNKNSSAIKRIMQEARELAEDPCTDYTAAPLEDDIFEWHCTIRGPPGTEFEGGLYHFRILLPSEYPFRPPSIMMLTSNGRFELNTKICISFTNYHEELWQPAWGVRTAIIGLQGFFPLKGSAAVGVGAIEYPASERKRLAALSKEWHCPRCNKSNLESLPDVEPKKPDISKAHSEVSNGESGTKEQPVQPVQSDASNSNEPMADEPAPAPSPQPIKVIAPTPTRPLVSSPLITATAESSPSPISVSTCGMESKNNSDNEDRDPARPAALDIRIPSSGPSVQAQMPIIIHKSTPRPPIVLDTAICVLLVLVLALICRRIL